METQAETAAPPSMPPSPLPPPPLPGSPAHFSGAPRTPLDEIAAPQSQPEWPGSSSSAPAPPAEKRARAPEKECAFCHDGEDSDDPDEDPLVPIESGQKQLYAHENCIWWCPDLYQDRDLKWQNVGKALRRCHTLKCAKCGEGDAPLGCKREACRKTWHYPCALDPSQGLVILEDEFCVACPKCHEILKREEREAAKRQAEATRRELAGFAPKPAAATSSRAPAAPTASALRDAETRALAAEASVARLQSELAERRAAEVARQRTSKATLEKMFTARKERDAAHRERDAAQGERDAAAAQLAALDEGAEQARRALEEAHRQAREEASQEAAKRLARARGEADAMVGMTLHEAAALAPQLAGAAARVATRHAQLAEAAEEERQKRTECAVCFSSARTIAFDPCGHIACCNACALQVGQCPVCKQGIQRRVSVFLP